MGRHLIGRALAAVAAGAAALALAGCGGGEKVAEEVVEQEMEEALGTAGGDVEIDLDEEGEGSITVEGEDGDSTFSFGGGELPEGFPESLVLAGADIESASTIASAEGDLQMVAFVSDQSLAELFAFYLDALPAAGFEVQQQMQSTEEGSESFTIMGEADGSAAIVTGYLESDRSVAAVTLTQEPTP